MPEPWLILVTCADAAEAARIAHALLEARLAACAHLRPHHAIYRWHGAIEHADETGLLIKTLRRHDAPAQALIRALHSYDTPAIIAFPVTADAATAAWLAAETAPS